MNQKKMVLFDWNGTLADDAPVWHASIKKIFEFCGITPPSIEEYFRRLENMQNFVGVYQSFGVALAPEELDRIYAEEYQKHLAEIKLSAGTIEILNALRDRDVVLGIVTIQLQQLLTPVLLRLDLWHYFKYVVVATQKKSVVISNICACELLEPQNCHYVGDTPSDIRHAKAAGVKSVAYLNPHIPEDLLLATKPDFAIRQLEEILGLV